MDDYKKMIDTLWKASAAYYVSDDPILTDAEYDALYRKVVQFEKDHPDMIDPNSPTQKVGGSVHNSFEKVEHPRLMGSLNNVFTEDEMNAFGMKSSNADSTWIVEPKLDGLTLVVHYENGELVKAVTRGDGAFGEDVTESAKTIRNLPLKISLKGKWWARGEVVMLRDTFIKLNAELVKAGEKPFANARNAAAGSLRQKDPKKTAERRLDVFFYDCDWSILGDLTTEISKLNLIHHAGLPVVQATKPIDSIALVYKMCEGLAERRQALPYDIDGAVIKYQSLKDQQTLGEGTKCPNWAVAYKFPAEHVCSRLKWIEWQVGRTGRITPVAEIDPVNLGGSIVERASLHNVDYIKAMGLKINDEVSLYKAAEIIPQVEKVIFHRANSKEITIPNVCPACGETLIVDGADLVCPNKRCLQKIKAWIQFFGARDHMDIQGLGEVAADLLVEQCDVRSPADLYDLKKEDLEHLPGFGKRKAELLYDSIQTSKQKPFDKVLASLGIDSLGDTTSKFLAKFYASIDEIRDADMTVLMALDGFGDKTVRALKAGLNDPDMVTLVTRLDNHGLNVRHTLIKSTAEKKPLDGLSICITGTLSKERSYFQDLIESNGGKFASSVTSKTSYLVAGEGGGSKRKKAESLGVPVISEAELERMINGK